MKQSKALFVVGAVPTLLTFDKILETYLIQYHSFNHSFYMKNPGYYKLELRFQLEKPVDFLQLWIVKQNHKGSMLNGQTGKQEYIVQAHKEPYTSKQYKSILHFNQDVRSFQVMLKLTNENIKQEKIMIYAGLEMFCYLIH